MNILCILTEPEVGFFKECCQFFFGCRTDREGTVSELQIDTIFTHGILAVRDLGVLYKGTCDKEGVWSHLIILPIDGSFSITKWYVVNFVAVLTMAVPRNRSLELFQNNIRDMKIISAKGKMKIKIIKTCKHG